MNTDTLEMMFYLGECLNALDHYRRRHGRMCDWAVEVLADIPPELKERSLLAYKSKALMDMEEEVYG